MEAEISAVKEKRDLVDRVANSPTFLRSPRLREFLIYVADCTIDERLEDTREQQIAANVFNRKPDYNAGQDNIVRVEARSLRKRLEAYFEADGKNEPTIICMPKGSYAICFEARTPEFGPAPVLTQTVETVEPTAAVPPKRRMALLVPALCAVIATLLIVVTVQWWYLAQKEKADAHPGSQSLPFSALIQAGKDTEIVTSDSGLVLIEELRRRMVSLDDYITGRYTATVDEAHIDPTRQDMIRLLLQRRYTNVAEMGIAIRIIQRNSWATQRLFLRSGHGVQLSDFKNHNAILFGSTTSNPWTVLFSEKLNFQFDWDPSRRGLFRNRSPRAGEQAVYSMTTNPGQTGKAYAAVAFLPNVNGDGHVLLIDGTTAEGTEAAGEFITDEVRVGAALKSMGIDPAGPPRYFEILLEAKAIAGNASQSTILATRLISDTR